MDVIQILMKAILLIILLVCGIQDIKSKRISLWIIILGALLIVSGALISGRCSVFDRIGGLAVGACVLLISIATKGKIGLGDGLLLCVTGLTLGFWGNIELFGLALLLAAVLSIFLLVFRLADRKKSIPFVPFLFFGYLFIMITEGQF